MVQVIASGVRHYLLEPDSLPNIVSLTAFEIFDVQVMLPRSRTVQGHPRSNVTIPIDSPGVVSYSTSIDPVMVWVTVFDIFEIKAIFP